MSTKENINRMAEAFCRWPLPKTVKPDLCAMDQDYPHRTGTNLLTFAEAKAMVEFILKEDQSPARQEGETPRTDAALELMNHNGRYNYTVIPVDFARTLERELLAKQAEVERLTTKVENQRERIVYLEGATNHACGTPLSLEKSKNDKLRAELESLKAAQGWRPAESAVPDEPYLVWGRMIGRCVGYLDPVSGYWRKASGGGSIHPSPTHIADLPTPPVERSGE